MKEEKFRNKAWCIICHAEVEDMDACYCPKCAKEGRARDAEALKRAADTDDTNSMKFMALAAKTIELFMDEYEQHLKQLYRNPFSYVAQAAVRSDERYIRSKDFAILTMGKVDPARVISYKQQEVMREMKEHDQR